MIIKKATFIIMIIFTLTASGAAVDLNSLIKNRPVIIVDNDENGKLKSVTVYTIADVPFEILWNTILDIKSYREFTPRIKKIKIISHSERDSQITADFEIEVPFINLKYTLVYKYDKAKKTIDISRISGDLEGSRWSWKFKDIGDKTFIIYSGIIKNFSSLLERIDDETNAMAMGINVSTILSTVKINKERAEFLYNKDKAGETSPLK